MTTPASPTLLSTRTGGISFAQVFLLIAALGCIGIQVILLLQAPAEATGTVVARYLPGILGVLILVLGLLVWGRKGSSSLTRHHVRGKTSTGRTYEFALAAIAAPDLGRGAFILRDAATHKIVLQDRLPETPHFLGTLWLAQAYPELADAVWEAFAAEKGVATVPAVRSFIDHQGRTAFLDAGVVLDLDGTPCYFPTTATQPFVQPRAGQDLLSTHVLSQPMQLRFDPNPARLPMARFLAALAAVPAQGTGAAQGSALVETLLDAHGGCRLQAEENGWTGECAGYPVEVSPGGAA
jgi:hypothetical protein